MDCSYFGNGGYVMHPASAEWIAGWAGRRYGSLMLRQSLAANVRAAK